ncbi:peptidase S10 [Mucilaginibacter sp. S1162]|uniref:Peptidase S10 n=1 Tax=Mucilaginibacter humi TaxID=2732510 RepID=A0ABX1W0V8_9SPHI|nr:peptidase S10 [Mucilaginibacter humi]NNU33864.1 peptidase S10 [Mucilaginibacter humi]
MFRLVPSFVYRFRFISILLIAGTAVLLFSSLRWAPKHAAYRASAGDAAYILAVGRHHLKIDGKELAYQSSTGYLTIKDQKDQPLANIFYTAYNINSNITQRPITFVFNGGPGSAAIWLHMGAFGPVRADNKGYTTNPNSWLDFTDLVFIDPVGTGYSQAAEGVDARRFHGYRGDIHSIAQFIKTYLAANHREASPKFLTGESYGAVRAIGLTAYLQDSLQIKLAGLNLISPALNYRLVSFRKGNDKPFSYYLPTYALAAQYHRRLSPELQKQTPAQLIVKVAAFSNGTYAKFLKSGKSISADLVDTLSYFTGLNKALLKRTNGRITDSQFTKELLDNKVTGTFDSRAVGQTNSGDPSELAIRSVFTKAFQKYVDAELGYENHLPYLATTAMGDWNYGPEAADGYLDISATLKQVLLNNPDLRVKVSSGLYDLATPVATINYAINHLGLSQKAKQNISVDYYHEGHMIYPGNEANAGFKKAGEQFYHQILQKLSSIHYENKAEWPSG